MRYTIKVLRLVPAIILIAIYTFLTISSPIKRRYLKGEHVPAGGQSEGECITGCCNNIAGKKLEEIIYCGESSLKKGKHQTVASFSFFGEMTNYFYKGIKGNLDTLKEHYPSWQMRLYLDHTTLNANSTKDLCTLVCQTNRLDICSVRQVGELGDLSSHFPTVWRFLPLMDPYVDIMISRDLDSRFSQREVDAVREWKDSRFPFHVMKDHPLHGIWPILAGMFGARLDMGQRKKYANITRQLITEAKGDFYKTADQDLLNRIVFPQVANETLLHASYLCTEYANVQYRPFPTQRKKEELNFVGSNGEKEGENRLDAECPEECRPKDHLDWEKC